MKSKLLTLENFKKWLIQFLKGAAVKAALKKILGSAMAGGFKAWLIKYIVTELYEEVAEPLLKMALNRVGYAYDKHRGKTIIKRLENAEDQTTYDAATDDAFSR